MIQIPVYAFTGFLDSGKTKFIQQTLEDPRFNAGERTLLLVCEEGEEEYDISTYPHQNVFLEVVDQQKINTKQLRDLAKKYKIQRVVAELNGMQLVGDLYSRFPEDWVVAQEVMFADATTFINYNQNMRNQMVDKLRVCELVVFNRMDKSIDKMELHKIVRGVSRRADIAYEYPDGNVEYDDIEDPLPFDIDSPVIKIEDSDYAIWYRDLLEETDKYDGKTVKFKGICAYDNRMPDNTFVAGRHIMTCCIDDVEYSPIVCICKNKHNIQSRDWIMVTGTIKIEYCKFYQGKGPVIHIEDTAITSAPAQELATFY